MAIRIRPWLDGDVFLVWRPDNGETEDDAREFVSLDAEQASLDYAEWDDRNSADYTIVKGTDATVWVRRKDGGEVDHFTVSGETVPHYTAKRKDT